MAEKEYIAKEFVIDAIEELKTKPMPKALLFDHLTKLIEIFPTEDFAPVKHGHWIDWGGFGSLNNGFIPEYKCSVCNSILHSKRSYCGNCGAKMDGGEEE